MKKHLPWQPLFPFLIVVEGFWYTVTFVTVHFRFNWLKSWNEESDRYPTYIFFTWQNVQIRKSVYRDALIVTRAILALLTQLYAWCRERRRSTGVAHWACLMESIPNFHLSTSYTHSGDCRWVDCLNRLCQAQLGTEKRSRGKQQHRSHETNNKICSEKRPWTVRQGYILTRFFGGLVR